MHKALRLLPEGFMLRECLKPSFSFSDVQRYTDDKRNPALSKTGQILGRVRLSHSLPSSGTNTANVFLPTFPSQRTSKKQLEPIKSACRIFFCVSVFIRVNLLLNTLLRWYYFLFLKFNIKNSTLYAILKKWKCIKRFFLIKTAP
jgi:hypothetical protein